MGTEILIARDDFDNISVDVYEDGEVLGGKFEFLGVFDPSDYPYFFLAFEWYGNYYDVDSFLKAVKNIEYANIFKDEFLKQMKRWRKDEI